MKREQYHRVERAYGTFSRSFTLPNVVDTDKIKAEFKDGVLRVDAAEAGGGQAEADLHRGLQVKTRKSAPKTASKRPSTKRPAGPAAARPRPAPGRSAQTTGGHLMAKVKPLRDRVLVRRIEEAEQKVGGIIIPDTAKEKPLQAEVMAVGSGRLLDNGQKVALTLKAGDKVLIGKWSGTEVKIDDEELLILKEDEILGILS